MNETIKNRYIDKLHRIPPPGAGCHTSLLGMANLGALAGIPSFTVFQDIRAAIPHGRRRVGDNEIRAAVQKAFAENAPIEPETGNRAHTHARPAPPPPPPFDGKRYLAELLRRSAGATEADLWEASPCRIDWAPGADDALALLSMFYDPEETLFIGDVYGKHVLPVSEHIGRIEAGNIPPHIIPNPLDGREHETASGTSSFRCDAAVSAFRFAVVEFDELPRQDQTAFWYSIVMDALLPVAALIDSGGKSIHAWLGVNLPDIEAWNREVRDGLYHGITGRMTLLGADRACQNPSRLSRLPGHFRREKGAMQRLLYFNPQEIR